MGKLKYIALALLITVLTGCSKKLDDKPDIFILIGETKIPLAHRENISALRKEISSHIKNAWDNRKGNESEWITVYSIYGEIRQGKGQEMKLNSTCTVSTDTFRIIKKSDNLFITVRKDDPDKAGSSSNTGNWNVLEVLLNGFLNDSILQHILDNRHVLQFQKTPAASNPLGSRPQ